MDIGELIVELQKLDPKVAVCGQSETRTWVIEPDDLVVQEDSDGKFLILGYTH